ncbi:MAG: helix-turn-helix domain-containing protein [Patescibacteria group bacterium]|nr:helix-turn-helix domain-containing protein [Patescibacteria group bacterium]
MTKEMLLDHLSGKGKRLKQKSVKVYLHYIRQQLLAEGGKETIDTVWGRGYCLRASKG